MNRRLLTVLGLGAGTALVLIVAILRVFPSRTSSQIASCTWLLGQVRVWAASTGPSTLSALAEETAA